MATQPALAELLLSYMRTLHEKIKRSAPSKGLTLPQIQALRCIAENRNAQPALLVQSLCLAPPSITALITGLVKNGLVRRGSDPDDRRASILILTPKGKRTLNARMKIVMREMQLLLQPLSKQEQQTLRILLAKML